MNTPLRSLLVVVAALTANTLGCAATHHPTTPATSGVARSSVDLVALLDTPGPVTLESIDSADWSVPLSGLVNLEHPAAIAAHKVDGPEPIVIPLHVIRHPVHGTFLIDTGVEEHALDPDISAVRGIVTMFFNLNETLTVKRSLAAWLRDEHAPLAGVFLTHLHLDHIMGLPDVPKGTPIFTGPGETSPTSIDNLFVSSAYDRLLDGHGPLREWQFANDASDAFDGVVDIFGDGSVWALWVPGHTPGSTAYLVRTPTGPVLLTGDASHTRWGWDHDVEPGSYTLNATAGRHSFEALRRFAQAHPEVEVRVGHQH